MFLEGLLRRKGILSLMLAMAILFGMAPQTAMAMPVDSQLIVHQSAARGMYIEKVQSFLNKEIVQNRLSKLGMNEQAVSEYIGQLDDARLEQLAKRVDTINAAGDTGVVILLVVLLVMVCVMYFADYRIKLVPREHNPED